MFFKSLTHPNPDDIIILIGHGEKYKVIHVKLSDKLMKIIVLQGVSCIKIMIIVIDVSFKLGFINREKEFSRFSIFNLLRNRTPPLTTK